MSASGLDGGRDLVVRENLRKHRRRAHLNPGRGEHLAELSAAAPAASLPVLAAPDSHRPPSRASELIGETMPLAMYVAGQLRGRFPRTAIVKAKGNGAGLLAWPRRRLG